MSAGHRTSVGRLPEVRAVSWSCGCGAGQVLDYGMSVDEGFAVQLAFDRAARHRDLAARAGRKP